MKKIFLMISILLLFLPTLVFSLSIDPTLISCTRDDQCPAEYKCYYSRYCGPGGVDCGEIQGDLKCHKKCTADSDCTSPEKCQNIQIFQGDVGTFAKICLQQTTTTTTGIGFPSVPTSLKDVYNFFSSINPFVLLIFGIILLVVAKLAKYVAIALVIFAIIQIILLLVR